MLAEHFSFICSCRLTLRIQSSGESARVGFQQYHLVAEYLLLLGFGVAEFLKYLVITLVYLLLLLTLFYDNDFDNPTNFLTSFVVP